MEMDNKILGWDGKGRWALRMISECGEMFLLTVFICQAVLITVSRTWVPWWCGKIITYTVQMLTLSSITKNVMIRTRKTVETVSVVSYFQMLQNALMCKDASCSVFMLFTRTGRWSTTSSVLLSSLLALWCWLCLYQDCWWDCDEKIR